MSTRLKSLSSAAAAGLLLAACSSSGLWVHVRTQPSEAIVSLRELDGADNELESTEVRGDQRIQLTDSSDVQRIVLEVESRGFHPKTLSFTPDEVRALPTSAQREHVIDVELEVEYSLVDELVVVYDPGRQEFVGRTRKVRAFRKTSEEGGRVVSRVYDQIPSGHGVRGMDISPDGRLLVFAEATPRERAYASEPGDVVELEACNLKGFRLRDERGRRLGSVSMTTHLTAERFRDVDPTFTPDGRYIRFASNRRRRHRADVVQIRSQAREGGVQNIYVDNRDYTVLTPSMAQDDTTVFAMHPPDAEPGDPTRVEIWSIGGPNTYPTEITKGSQPRISPDGSRIAYIGADLNLWVINADGTNPTQLTTRALEIRQNYLESLSDEEAEHVRPELIRPYASPAWGPNGRYLVYTSMQGQDSTGRNNADIWLLDLTNGSPQQLTTNGSVDTHPRIDPKLESIFFYSNRGGRWAIWSIAMPQALEGA